MRSASVASEALSTAPSTMVTAKVRECQGGASGGHPGEAFRHYELETVPCPRRADFNSLDDVRQKIGRRHRRRRRRTPETEAREQRPPRVDGHELGVREPLGEHAAGGAEP